MEKFDTVSTTICSSLLDHDGNAADWNFDEEECAEPSRAFTTFLREADAAQVKKFGGKDWCGLRPRSVKQRGLVWLCESCSAKIAYEKLGTTAAARQHERKSARTCAYSGPRGSCNRDLDGIDTDSRYCELHTCPVAGCYISKRSTMSKCYLHNDPYTKYELWRLGTHQS